MTVLADTEPRSVTAVIGRFVASSVVLYAIAYASALGYVSEEREHLMRSFGYFETLATKPLKQLGFQDASSAPKSADNVETDAP